MQTLQGVTGVALHLLLKVLGLIFPAELELLDLALLLSAWFVHELVLGLQFELTTQLAFV